MRKILPILLSIACCIALPAKSLEDCSLILWPKYDWIGSNLEAVADQKLKDGDYIVYPGALGLKGWFRSDEYQIKKERVLLELDHATAGSGFYTTLEKHQDSIGGIMVTEFDPEVRFSLQKSNRRRFHEYLAENGQSLSYCVDKKTVDRPANLDFLGGQCDQLIIYFDRALLLEPEKTVAFFKESCSRARANQKDVKILAGIELKFEENEVDQILDLFEQVSAQIDGIFVVLEGSASQRSTAVRLMSRLRG